MIALSISGDVVSMATINGVDKEEDAVSIANPGEPTCGVSQHSEVSGLGNSPIIQQRIIYVASSPDSPIFFFAHVRNEGESAWYI